MTFDVVVIGSLNYDILIQQDRLPQLGETYTGKGLMMMPGGKGANQAVQCARLGLQVNMVGCVGEDIYGQELLQSLSSNQIRSDNIRRSGTSGVGIVQILKEGDYCSTIIKGANYLINEDDIRDELFSHAPLLILQSEIPEAVVACAIKKARAAGCRILLNNAPARHIADDLLRLVDYLVVNETEAQQMTGQTVNDVEQATLAARDLHRRTGATVVITLGEKGSLLYSGSGEQALHFPASRCARVVDTTGAGDAFIGGLAWCLVKGVTLEQGIPFASRISAHAIQKYGGQNAFPWLAELEDVPELRVC